MVHPPRRLAIERGARRCWRRFTPVALGAFAATVVAGGLEAITQLGSIQALFDTAYGRVLLVKMALVALMLPLSAMAWRLKRPHVRVEAALAAGVVAAAALLSSFPTPPTTAARQAAEDAAATPTAGLPSGDELTMAGAAGSVLVGLSLSPGLPGPNRATVYLLPIDGTAAAQGLAANITVNGVYKALRPLRRHLPPGDDRHRAGRHGVGRRAEQRWRRGAFTIPSLPAPSGDTLLAKLETAMKALTAYQYNEVLNPGTENDSRKLFIGCARPDDLDGQERGHGRIWIGTTQYLQNGPGQPWQQQTSPAERLCRISSGTTSDR